MADGKTRQLASALRLARFEDYATRGDLQSEHGKKTSPEVLLQIGAPRRHDPGEKGLGSSFAQERCVSCSPPRASADVHPHRSPLDFRPERESHGKPHPGNPTAEFAGDDDVQQNVAGETLPARTPSHAFRAARRLSAIPRCGRMKMTGPGFRDERDGTVRRLVLLKRDPAAFKDACILLNAKTSGERQPMPSGPHMRSCDLSVSATALDVNKQTHLHQAPDGWRDAGDAAHVIHA
ncbi:hypothetical protein JHW43_003550 [Diplocarpon mali]|nr:hypothetical protein JHW43_003550 [Diplocarpon mali]